jgi:NAD(P)-dependent dehydrogenase (short-subunit alcohol dehydrogenase family)
MARSILITGCSSGIGYHCVHGMKARGWHVIAACRKPADVDRLRGEGLDCVLIDYDDDASIHAGFEAALAMTGGRLDVLFNNGAYGTPAMVEDLPTEALRANFESNFFGWHTLTRRALVVMRGQGAGRIVQCSSILGFITLPARAAYNASKFAVEGLSDTMRLELHGSGIHVCLIEPGPVTSKIRVNSIPHYEKWVKPHAAESVWADFYGKKLEPRLYEGGEDRFELGPDSVLKRLIHASESARPKPRYYVTTPTYMMGFLKRILPVRALDWVLRRAS